MFIVKFPFFFFFWINKITMNLSFNRQRTNSTIKCILVTHIFRRMYFSIHYVGFKIPFHVIFRRSRAPINMDGHIRSSVTQIEHACSGKVPFISVSTGDKLSVSFRTFPCHRRYTRITQFCRQVCDFFANRLKSSNKQSRSSRDSAFW